MFFLWVKLTIGISRKKISNPFKDNKGHFETPLINFSLWYSGSVVNNWKKGRPLWNKQKEYPEYLP
jgi:hypothetical protein